MNVHVNPPVGFDLYQYTANCMQNAFYFLVIENVGYDTSNHNENITLQLWMRDFIYYVYFIACNSNTKHRLLISRENYIDALYMVKTSLTQGILQCIFQFGLHCKMESVKFS